MGRQVAQAELPPPGYARDEELKQREDVVAELNDTTDIEVGTGSVLDYVEVESELAQHFDELEVQGAVPGRVYSWVPTHTTGRFVQQKLYKGWQIVKGDMPEAAALQGTDTTRKLGDVILMWIPQEKHDILERREKIKKIQQEQGVTSYIQELAERNGTQVITPDNITPDMLRRMQTRAEAKTRASKTVNRWMQQGRMPGMGLN